VKYLTGSVACYDLDGNRKWMVPVTFTRGNTAECASPVLVGNKLVVKLPFHTAKKGQKAEGPDSKLVAFDALTGKEAWVAPFEGNGDIATPVVMRLTDGKEEMDVVVDRAGVVVRAADGKVLIRQLHGGESRGTPTPVGDRIYRLGSCYGLHCVEQLIMLSRDVVGAKPVASHYYTQRVGDAGYAWHGNVLYSIAGRGGFMAHNGFWPVSVTNGRQVVWRVNRGGAYAQPAPGEPGVGAGVPTTVAGDYVFLADRGTGPRVYDRQCASVTVIQTGGPDGRIVAQNKVDRGFTAHFAFAGDQTSVRTDKALTCIAYTGEAGKAYEAKENARRLFEDLDVTKPTDVAPITAMPTNATTKTLFVYGLVRGKTTLLSNVAHRADPAGGRRNTIRRQTGQGG
jgi:hypothetical protein